ALAVWSVPQKRLVLARDRLGIKPLYIYRAGSDLVFSSEVKGIFQNSAVSRHLDVGGLNLFLCLNYVPAPATLVAGIEKLPPGQMLDWVDGKALSFSYWRPHFSVRQRTLESAKEELDALLKDAVREQMVSDVPIGVWASGGLDSSTIVHYASEECQSRLK